MKKLTKTQRERYVQREGCRCPYCNSDQLGGGSYDGDAGYITQSITCLDCEKSWTDVYKLIDIEEDE